MIRTLFYLRSVVVDQASFQDDRTLIIRKRSHVEYKLLKSTACNNVCFDIRCSFTYRTSDIRYEQIVKILKRKISSIYDKRQHTPVYQVTSVTLCCIFVCYVRPAAEHFLAACGLFPC